MIAILFCFAVRYQIICVAIERELFYPTFTKLIFTGCSRVNESLKAAGLYLTCWIRVLKKQKPKSPKLYKNISEYCF